MAESTFFRLPMRAVAHSFSVYFLLAQLTALGAQPVGEQAMLPLTDEQIAQRLIGGDSYAVDAINRHDAYGVAGFFWDDAVDITSNGLVRGRAAIEQRLREQFKRFDPRSFAETIDEAHVSGDRAWLIGHWSDTYVPQPGAQRLARSGYVAAVLERRDGEWKAVMHVFFAGSRPQGPIP